MSFKPKYRLNVYWKDIFISNFDTLGDNPDFVYKEYSDSLIRTGLQDGMSLPQQKKFLIQFCEKIYERKRDKRKIPTSDHFFFLAAFFGLHKLNYTPTYDSYIFLKKKNKIRRRLS